MAPAEILQVLASLELDERCVVIANTMGQMLSVYGVNQFNCNVRTPHGLVTLSFTNDDRLRPFYAAMKSDSEAVADKVTTCDTNDAARVVGRVQRGGRQ